MREQLHLTGTFGECPSSWYSAVLTMSMKVCNTTMPAITTAHGARAAHLPIAEMPLSFDSFLLDDNLQVSGHVFV